MGRKKKTTIIEEPEDSENLDVEGLLPTEARQLREEEELERWIGEFQAKFPDQPIKVSVQKYVEGEWQWCKRYPLSTFDFENVYKEWGPGRYRFRMVDGQYRYVKGGSSEMIFARPDTPQEVEKKPENPLENPVVAMMIQSMKSNTDMMMTLFQSMIQGQSTQKSGIGEIIEGVKTIQTMTSKGEKPLESFKEILSSWKLLQEITGGEKATEKSGLMGEIREFLEMAPLLKENLPHLKALLPQNSNGPAPAGPVPQPEVVMMDPLTKKISEIVPLFVSAAKTQADVGKWGKYLLDVTDVDIVPLLLPSLQKQYGPLVKDEDDVYDILLKLGKDAGEREKIFVAIKPLSPYKEWVGRVLDEAIRLAESDETPAEDAVVSAVNGSSTEEK